MAVFQYAAIPKSGGTIVKGRLEADTARQARAVLRERGLLVSAVEQKQSSSSLRVSLSLANTRLTRFTQQLAALLDAALTVDEALTVVSEQSDNDREKQLVASLRNDIAAGLSLSAAMNTLPKAFPAFYPVLVQAGEQAGHLPGVMQRLSVYLERRAELTSRAALAFVYPAVVFVVSVFVVMGMLAWVVPQMVQVFQGAKQTLPVATRILLSVSAWVGTWGGWCVLLSSLAGAAFWLGLQHERFCFSVHAWRLKLPLFGQFERSTNTARFASTLAILAGSGVPLLPALAAAEGVMTNRVQCRAAREAAHQVREGVSLSRALAASGQFPPILVHLTANGEATGRLDRMLEKAAQELSRELARQVETFTALLGPAIVLLMGAIVLFIVLAILLPVFEINQFVK